MGFRITRYSFGGVAPNSQVDLGDLLLCDDPRSVIHGRVVDCAGDPVANAVVKVFVATECDANPCDCETELVSLGHVFTDECGQFIFPVCPGNVIGPPVQNQTFLLKIFAVDNVTQDAGDVNLTPCPSEMPCCDAACPTCTPVALRTKD